MTSTPAPSKDCDDEVSGSKRIALYQDSVKEEEDIQTSNHATIIKLRYNEIEVKFGDHDYDTDEQKPKSVASLMDRNSNCAQSVDAKIVSTADDEKHGKKLTPCTTEGDDDCCREHADNNDEHNDVCYPLPTIRLRRQQPVPNELLVTPGAHPMNPSRRTIGLEETQSQDDDGFRDIAAVMSIDNCRHNSLSLDNNDHENNVEHSSRREETTAFYDWEDENNLTSTPISEEVTSPSSPEILSLDANNFENEDNPRISVARPVKAFLANDAVLVNATAITNNRMIHPSHVIAATLTCLVILGVIGVSVLISSKHGDDHVPSQSPAVSPTVNTGDGIVPTTNGNGLCFESTVELRNAVAGYLEGDPNGTISKTYGSLIGSWCVDKVTDFSFIFCSFSGLCPVSHNKLASEFNEDISRWNTSSATNMSYMFAAATSFNQDISSWDVSSVTKMIGMFAYADSFNHDISSWNVSSVSDLSGMFSNARSFNQDISSWNISSAWDVSYMFDGATLFDKDISSWDVSSVTHMIGMFANTDSFNQDISSWVVASVKDLSGMFINATMFNQDISSWNVSSATDMSYMFSYAVAFNHDISSWNVSSVVDMSEMFSSAVAFNQSLCSWGVKLQNPLTVDMFNEASSCPTTSKPDLTSSPPGPFCHPCT